MEVIVLETYYRSKKEVHSLGCHFKVYGTHIFAMYNMCSISLGCSIPWGIHKYRGGTFEYREGCSVP